MKAKGLIVKPYPEHWTKWMNPDKPNEKFTKEEIEFNNSILIEKRPYFMKHLYLSYKAQYKDHYDTYDYFCNRKYGIHMNELLNLENKTEEQQKLVDNYNKYNPLLETDCVMNNICRYMEKQIKEVKINANKVSPDYVFDSLFNKNIEITQQQIDEMEKVYRKYKKQKSTSNNIKNDERGVQQEMLSSSDDNLKNINLDYISEDIQVLANLAVYVNYKLYPKAPKSFCWDLFGRGMILNLYDNSNHKFTIPLRDENGDIDYMYKKYKNKEVKIECQ